MKRGCFARKETEMNRILSLVRRCVEDYEMIAPNDRVAVGVSGGKDSLMLLTALAKIGRASCRERV